MTYPTPPLNGTPSPHNSGEEQAQQPPTVANGNTTTSRPSRLLSLDLLRGMDLAFLVLFQPMVYQWIEACQPAAGTFGAAVYGQITHVPWQGFCFWDIIMPLFMFMSGITIPFSMSKYRRGESKAGAGFLLRLLKRFVVLWLLGMVVQGNLLALDARLLHLYSNTLQSIAVGYVVVALLFVYTSWRTQLAVVVGCMVAYVAVFAIWGRMDFTIDANICEEIDRQVLGRWRDGVIWNGNQWQWDATYHYTWILSSLNFVATVYLGYLAGVVLRTSKSGTSKLRILLLSGVGLIVVAYVLGEYVSFSSLTDSFFYGFKPLLGTFYPVLGATMQGIFVLLVLRWMYKSNIFVKA